MAVQQYGSPAAWQYSSVAVQQYGSAAVHNNNNNQKNKWNILEYELYKRLYFQFLNINALTNHVPSAWMYNII